MLTKFIKLISLLTIVLLVSSPALADTRVQRAQAAAGKYTNPLPVQIPTGGMVESCADPSIIYANDGYWYMYCTTDPLNGNDKTGNNFNFRLSKVRKGRRGKTRTRK